MGEYASYQGESIKIGTCESMYYLRADQAHLVKPEAGSVDPIRDAAHIRFRFPFPGEDNIAPGQFSDHDRGLTIPGTVGMVPEGIEHGRVQFTMNYPTTGYNVTLPCPQGPDAHPDVRRNGASEGVQVVQQRVWNGHLATVVRCAGCHTAWRLPELEDAEPIIVALRSAADALYREAELFNRPPDANARTYHEVANRIADGYLNPPAWVSNVKQPA